MIEPSNTVSIMAILIAAYYIYENMKCAIECFKEYRKRKKIYREDGDYVMNYSPLLNGMREFILQAFIALTVMIYFVGFVK